MTVRNVEVTIRACLASIVAQDYRGSFDILIIDAESTDATPTILHEFANSDSRIHVVTKASSQPEAYNFAIDQGLLTGEIVAMIDGDCVADRDWLSQLVSALGDWEAAGGIGLTPPELRGIARVIGYDLDYRFLRTSEGLVKRHPNMNLAVRRRVLEKIRFEPSLKVGYDTDFGYRLSAAGYRIRFTKAARVMHYHRATFSAYFRQQRTTARYAVQVYLKQRQASRGDNINPPWMLAQPLAVPVLVGSVLVALIVPSTWLFSALAATVLLALHTVPAIAAAVELRALRPAWSLPPLYLFRTLCWWTGIIQGLGDLAQKRE